MDGQGLRMCRFTRDGIPELGEYLESVDGTGICKLTELDGGGEEVVVCLPDGTMPEGISDLELVRVPTRIEEGDAKTETMSDETAERMARTRFIVDEYLFTGRGGVRGPCRAASVHRHHSGRYRCSAREQSRASTAGLGGRPVTRICHVNAGQGPVGSPE